MARQEPVANPHALVIPFPGQGHFTPAMQLSKKLASQGFSITFVNSHIIHERMLNSRKSSGSEFAEELKLGIRLESVQLPGAQNGQLVDLGVISERTTKMKGPVAELLDRLAREGRRITCIISDALTSSWTQELADRHHIPRIAFFTCSHSFYMIFFHFPLLLAQGQLPFAESKSEDDTGAANTNAFARDPDSVICNLPGLPPLRVRDFPTFIHNGDATRYMYDFLAEQLRAIRRAERVLVNTIYDLESSAIDCLSEAVPTYAIGPLLPPAGESKRTGTSLLPEQDDCLQWLDEQPAGSVVYVSFGSVTKLSLAQFQEVALGLQASQQRFLWVLRPALIIGHLQDDPRTHLPTDFLSSTKERACLVSWAPQLQVLAHAAVGAFVTHCGWNSMLESIANGVPMMGWPYFADQMLNCRLMVQEWGVGMEMKELRRDEVESVLRAMMEGEEGQVMKRRASLLKVCADVSIREGEGHSFNNIQAFVQQMRSILDK